MLFGQGSERVVTSDIEPRGWPSNWMRLAVFCLFGALAMTGAMTGAVSARAQTSAGADTAGAGQGTAKIIRFASLKAQPVNMRRGPGTQYPIVWIMRQAGTPLGVLQDYEGWSKVRDADGAEGWIHGSLLSRRRTALVAPDKRSADGNHQLFRLMTRADPDSRVVAKIEAGALVSVTDCSRRWCAVKLLDFSGYLPRQLLWGISPSDTF